MAATNAQLAAWLIANSDKKGTPEFDTVGRQYVATKGSQTAPTPAAAPASEPERAAGVERPGILGTGLDILQAGAEVPLSMLTGMGAGVYAGLEGLSQLDATGGDGAAAAQAVEEAQQKYTFQPRTAYGQTATNALGELFSNINKPGEAIASAGYPGLGAGVTTGANALALVFGGPAARALGRGASGANVGAMLRQGINAPRASARQQQTGAVSLSGAPAPMPAPAAAAVPPPAPPPLSAVAPPPAGPVYSRAALLEMGRQFKRDNPTATAAERAANMTEMARLSGGEARVADVAGRRLLDTMATLPGETTNLLTGVRESRAAGRPERLDPVVDIIGGGAGRAGTVASNLVTTQRATAAPLYAAVHAMDVPVTPELNAILARLENSKAYSKAEGIAKAEGVPFALSAPSMPATVNMRQLDLVKQGADDLISGALDSDPTLARSLGNLNTEYKAALDTATGGAYADARAAFAGPAASLTALKLGRKSNSKNAAQRAEETASMGPAELQHYRIGAAEQLREQIGNRPGQNKLMNEKYDRNVREQLMEIMPNAGAYEKALKIIKNEKKLKELESVGQGSPTAARLAMDEDMTATVVEGMTEVSTSAARGNWKEALNSFMKFSKRLKLREPVRNEIGRALLSKDPGIFKLIESAQAEALAARATAARAVIPTAVVTAGPQPAAR